MIALAVALATAPLAPVAVRDVTVPLRRCEVLAGLRIDAAALSLPSRGARVSSAVRVPASAPSVVAGERVLALGAHCRVQGQVLPRDPLAPPIHFNINLPLAWNGVALQSAGGGMGGAVSTAPGEKGSGMIDPDSPAAPYRLTRGYVTFGSDEGHGRGDFAFYRSDEAMRNWAVEYLKKARDVALTIVDRAYDARPRRLYLTGESAGGREVVRAAQRFGDAYDGFIATSPVLSWNAIHLADNVTRSRLVDGFLDQAAVKIIADRSRDMCDASDGLADGVLARYLDCDVPEPSLACADGRAGATCLSTAQVAALTALRRGWRAPAGVTFAHGLTGFPGYGVTGDEDGPRYQYAFYPIGLRPPSRRLAPGSGIEKGIGAILNFGAVWVRHAIVQDPAFDPFDFDPRPYAARIRYLSDLYDATDPDLSAMVRRGGKLLLLQPSADNAVSTPMVADYYRSVVTRMGQRDADRALRFWVGPGGGHNVVGMSHVDLLGRLEAWVDDGVPPPDTLVAEQVDDLSLRVVRTMPACRYPTYARYDGKGDPGEAASFRCTDRPDPRH